MKVDWQYYTKLLNNNPQLICLGHRVYMHIRYISSVVTQTVLGGLTNILQFQISYSD